MQVGGEFYYDESWLLDSPVLDTAGAFFLSGGRACLELIAACLRVRGFERVLLPSYLCPVIPAAMTCGGLGCAYYRVHEDLSIDLGEVERKILPRDAFFYINYFGFPPAAASQSFFNQLRSGGVPVIADNAQAGLNPKSNWINASVRGKSSDSDFSFNSLRKFIPYDGGFLRAGKENTSHLEKLLPPPCPDSPRLSAVRAYRARLGAYLQGAGGAKEHRTLVSLYHQAEHAYTQEPLTAGDPLERAVIERLDWPRICRKRRENYAYLLELLGSVPSVRPLLPELPDAVMPLGLPVVLERVPRGRVLDLLGRAGIGATVHWAPTPRGVSWARRILTLPIDQRAGCKEMEYLALHLVRAIEMAR
jgi:hypothetical protein